MTDAQNTQSQDEASEPVFFALPVECQLRDAEQLLDQLQDASAKAPVLIEADAVEQMHSAMVLVLASVAAARAEAGSKIAVAKPSSAFTDAFKEMGLFKNLMSMEFQA